MQLSDTQTKALNAELKRRLLAYDKLFTFVNELANWDGTCNSWYDVFKSYQNDAKTLIDKISVK